MFYIIDSPKRHEKDLYIAQDYPVYISAGNTPKYSVSIQFEFLLIEKRYILYVLILILEKCDNNIISSALKGNIAFNSKKVNYLIKFR